MAKTFDARSRSKIYREGGEVAEKLRKKYKTDPKTGITDLSKRAGKDSPGYKEGKYWLRKAGKYVNVGSKEHKKDLKKIKE